MHLARLETNSAGALARVTDFCSTLTSALDQRARAFVSNAQRRVRAVDKRLEMKHDELDGIVITLETLLQQAAAGDHSEDFLEDSLAGIAPLLSTTDAFLPRSVLVSTVAVDVAVIASASSHLQASVDPTRSVVSHSQWFSRGECNRIVFTLMDSAGEIVHGITPADVTHSLTSVGEGWSVGPVGLDGGAASFDVTLAVNCHHAAVLRAYIGGASFEVPLKVRACAVCESHRYCAY